MVWFIRSYPRFGLVVSSLGWMAVLFISPVRANPIVGPDINHGGQSEILAANSDYNDQIYLFNGTGNTFLRNSRNAATAIAIADVGDPTTTDLDPENKFMLGMHMINFREDFFIGDGNNPTVVLGFEDLYGASGLDNHAAMIRVSGNLGVARIPGPWTMLLLGTGLIGLSFALRVK